MMRKALFALAVFLITASVHATEWQWSACDNGVCRQEPLIVAKFTPAQASGGESGPAYTVQESWNGTGGALAYIGYSSATYYSQALGWQATKAYTDKRNCTGLQRVGTGTLGYSTITVKFGTGSSTVPTPATFVTLDAAINAALVSSTCTPFCVTYNSGYPRTNDGTWYWVAFTPDAVGSTSDYIRICQASTGGSFARATADSGGSWTNRGTATNPTMSESSSP